MTLNQTIALGLNNPDCGFFVGHFTGSMYSLEFFIGVAIVWWLFRAADKLVLEPIINKIKNRKK